MTEADLYRLIDERDRLRERAEAGDKFKAFVHRYMDEHGVPHGDPKNEHQKAGCRIGARLDLMFAERDALLEENKRLKWRLNHQTDEDVEDCRRGKHEDCGA